MLAEFDEFWPAFNSVAALLKAGKDGPSPNPPGRLEEMLSCGQTTSLVKLE